MPSRERVITTITTDETTGEDIVLVETIERAHPHPHKPATVTTTTTSPDQLSIEPVAVRRVVETTPTRTPSPTRPSTPQPSTTLTSIVTETTTSITPDSHKKQGAGSSAMKKKIGNGNGNADSAKVSDKDKDKVEKKKSTPAGPKQRTLGSWFMKAGTSTSVNKSKTKKTKKTSTAGQKLTTSLSTAEAAATSTSEKSPSNDEKKTGTKRKAEDTESASTTATASTTSTSKTAKKRTKTVPASARKKSSTSTSPSSTKKTTKTRTKTKAKKTQVVLKPNLPNDEIKSIVLGAHGDFDWENEDKNTPIPFPVIAPPKAGETQDATGNGTSSGNANKNLPTSTYPATFRGIQVKAMLPQMVLSDEGDDDNFGSEVINTSTTPTCNKRKSSNSVKKPPRTKKHDTSEGLLSSSSTSVLEKLPCPVEERDAKGTIVETRGVDGDADADAPPSVSNDEERKSAIGGGSCCAATTLTATANEEVEVEAVKNTPKTKPHDKVDAESESMSTSESGDDKSDKAQDMGLCVEQKTGTGTGDAKISREVDALVAHSCNNLNENNADQEEVDKSSDDVVVVESDKPCKKYVDELVVVDEEEPKSAETVKDMDIDPPAPMNNELKPRKKQKKRANLTLLSVAEEKKMDEYESTEIKPSDAFVNDISKTEGEVIVVDVEEPKSMEITEAKPAPKAPLSMSIENEIQPRKKQKKRASLTMVREKDKSKASEVTDEVIDIVQVISPSTSAKEKKTTPARTSSSPKKSKTPANQTATVSQLSEEDASTVTKFDAMKEKYISRAKELVERGVGNSLLEEDFQKEAHEGKLVIPKFIERKESQEDVEFRDEWVGKLAELVQGSPLPIDDLARLAQTRIMEAITDDNLYVSVETVASKIKLIATRSQNLILVSAESGKSETPKVDIFADESIELMWRWDLISLDLLPSDRRAVVKKARTARRKLKLHQKAVVRLIQAIDDATACIRAAVNEVKKQRTVAKVSTEEEKVLKYEREEEKARLLNDAKRQKEIEKQRIAEEKRRSKELQEEAKKAEKAKKEEAKKVEKAKKEEEKERKKKEENFKKEEKAQKQRNFMRSFFEPATKTKSNSPAKSKSSSLSSNDTPTRNTHDSCKFWSMLSASSDVNTQPFAKMSTRAIKSRRRRVRNVNVSVFAPSVSDNPFDQQVYMEERVISIRNKYKFLSFREDERPPYHGTWSKPKSSIITGRNPFGKDSAYLDYDVDSEAEWEEGDDEMGEDCSESGHDEEEMMDDEEGDISKYNYQDGWLAQDDDLDADDDDEETKDLRRRKMQDSKNEGSESGARRVSKLTAACVIAPMKGGIPQPVGSDCPSLASECIEGIGASAAQELLNLHCSEILIPASICMNPFPPSLKTATKKSESGTSKSTSQEMSREDIITFAKFVHNSTIKSKDMIVEELRNAHKDITSSRAQAMRKLDSIAKKRRIKNGGGVIWEVKNDILESLDLHALVKNPPTEEESISPKKSSPKKSAKSNKTVSPKKNSGSTPTKASQNELDQSAALDGTCLKNASKETSDARHASPAPETTPKKAEDESPSKKRKTPASLSLLNFYAKKKKKTTT